VNDTLRDLYQELILDHSKKPRNFQKLADANRTARGHNPLCGDHITLFLRLDGDIIKDIAFQGSGCAISKASASLMTAALKGKTRAEAEALFSKFHEMLTGEPGAKVDADRLGKLAVFSGVCEFPARVKCATLAWHTLKGALDSREAPVTTE
jgi:nitrogen fixation NifU-like protein